jgi:hypothetical protein
MSTYTQVLYQVVFGSKDYTPFISTENEGVLFVYIAHHNLLTYKEELIYMLNEHSVDFIDDYLITRSYSTHSGVERSYNYITTDGTVAIGF